VLLPFWLALSASVALHVAVLTLPGWDLPFDDEPEIPTLDATIAMPAPAVTKPAPAVPARKKRPPPRPAAPPIPAAPVATVPGDSPVESPAETEPAPPESSPVVAESAAVAVSPAPTFASQWPRTGRIVYQVTRGEGGFIVGQSEQRWTHDATTYRLRAVTETTGLVALFRPVKVVHESRGTFDAAGLRPLEFDTQRDDQPQGSARFDVAQGLIFFGTGQSAAFVPAAQDLLSLFYQLGAIAFDVPQFTLTVMTGRKLATFVVLIGPQQELETPLGTRQTRHLKITGNAREDTSEIWLDVGSRLPLKIRYRDRKGDIFDQVATHIELGELGENGELEKTHE
jgi:hypothetical protein